MSKFGRNYILRIQTNDLTDWIIIQPPFTIEFDVVRSAFSAQNDASIRIYNLSALTRDKLRVDFFDFGRRRKIQLMAGYGQNMAKIFDGIFNHGFSVRNGVDFVTTVEGFDGGYGFKYAQANYSFGAGIPYTQILSTLADGLAPFGIAKGKITKQINKYTLKPIPVGGPILDSMKQFSDVASVFVDNGVVYVAAATDSVPGGYNVVNAQTGLLDTPILNQLQVTCNVLFEPRFILGQQIYLDTSTGSQQVLSIPTQKNKFQYAMNGFYKIYGIKHSAIISPTVNGPAKTSLTLMSGNFTDMT